MISTGARRSAFCIYDLAGRQSPLLTTAGFVYIRLHGPDGAYQGRYGDAALDAWAGRIDAWAGEGRAVYCYFDNDQRGYAALNAQDLKRRLD
jgi:uncharacterized protein YecE (DUF72 family)